MISYNNKSYIKTNVGIDTCDLIPIVINDDKSYTSFKENAVKGVSLEECKSETINTFLAKGNYFKSKDEFAKKSTVKVDEKVEEPKEVVKTTTKSKKSK